MGISPGARPCRPAIPIPDAVGWVAVLVAAVLGLGGCGDGDPPGGGRDLRGGILIGVAWPGDEGGFVSGVELAVEEVNQAGGLMGRPVQTVIDSREAEVPRATGPQAGTDALDRNMARRIALDLSARGVTAVVGHRGSAFAIPASAIYQQNGVLYLSPTSTVLSLTSFGFDLIFRMQPDSALQAMEVAGHFGIKGYKRVAVLQERSDYARELAALLLQVGSERYGIGVAANLNFPQGLSDQEVRSRAVEVSRVAAVDVIYLLAGRSDALRIFRELRHRGVTVPIYGGEGLDVDPFWSVLRAWREETGADPGFAVPTVADFQSGPALRFAQTFKRKYEQDPERLSALGYDAVKLVVQGIVLTQAGVLGEGVAKPLHVADELRYMSGCVGAAGAYKFLDDGNLREKVMFIKSLAATGFNYEQINAETASGLPECGDLDADDDTVVDKQDTCPHNSAAEIARGVYLEGKQRGCPIDTDGDGVPDYRDACPENTPQELVKGVETTGCPRDTDGDGVPDYRDRCPDNTAAEIAKGIDPDGCPVDTDKDGVPDYRDDCPQGTAEDLARGVDARGCPTDQDHDRIPDYRDDCPANRPQELGAGVDTRGCPLDSDGDGIPDWRDDCPASGPLEIAGGVNARGCPADRDRDGVSDYRDRCPDNTPAELVRGVDAQGCPVDADHDGVADLQDLCLHTRPAVAVDAAGCQVPLTLHFTAPVPFERGRAVLPPASAAALADFLRGLPADGHLAAVRITALTDDTGTPQANRRLAESRGQAILAALARGTVLPARLSIEPGPIAATRATGLTEEERARRRLFNLDLILTFNPQAPEPVPAPGPPETP